MEKQIKTSKKHGSTINFDTVREIGLALPGVEESTAYGSPALEVRGKVNPQRRIKRELTWSRASAA
jgi:hypothetical protein